MAYSFPGREVTLDCPAGTEVTSFRAFSGCERDHIFGLKSVSSWSLESATGQKPLFWAELLVLTFGLYYLDVITDLQQLALFASEGRYDYLVISCIGISIPIVTTLVEAMRWNFTSSPQCDLFRRTIPSMAARVTLIFLSVVSQLHMILLVICSIVMRTRHDLLLGTKHAEVAESGVSALLQSNYLLLILVALESVPSEAALRSLAISVTISVASLGFGFASRDKEDTKVLDVPGKLGWGPTFAGLIIVRTVEVTSRLLAINVVHLSTRSGISLGGPAAVAMLAGLSWLAFPEAKNEKSHVFAGIIAHPGQVLLGSRSQLPLRRSLCIHIFLQALAFALQGLLHMSPTMLPEAQVLPFEVLVVSLLATLGSTFGLCALAHYGSKRPHPFFKSVAKDRPLTWTMLATAAGRSPVPIPLLAAVEEEGIWLDLEAMDNNKNKYTSLFGHLASARTPVLINNEMMKLLEPLLEQHVELLSQINVVHADFSQCNLGSESEWSSKWAQLKWRPKAFRANETISGLWLQRVASWTELEEVSFEGCPDTGEVWKPLRDASWAQLRRATFRDCFIKTFVGNSGTVRNFSANPEPVLEALSRCQKLQVLDFDTGSDTLDKLLAEDCWPELQREKCNLPRHRIAKKDLQGEEVQTLQKFATRVVIRNEHGILDASLLSGLAHCHKLEWLDVSKCNHFPDEAWEALHEAQWPNLKVAKFGGNFKRLGLGCNEGRKVAIMVLRVLASCQKLERLDFHNCDGIPTEAFQVLHVTEWPALKEANWCGCFEWRTGEDFVVVLKLMARCRHLERINLSWCKGEDWEGLRGAEWPHLREADFGGCFGFDSKGLGLVLGLLSGCQRLEKVNLRSTDSGLDGWEALQHVSWPELQDADFSDIFCGFRRKINDVTLRLVLAMLSRCPKLERLQLGGMGIRGRVEVPLSVAADLQPLPAGCWPNLQYDDFDSDCEEELQRLRQGGPSPANVEVICQVDESIVPPKVGSSESPTTEVDVTGSEPELPVQAIPEVQQRSKKRRLRKVRKARQAKESPSNTQAEAAEANVEINFINLTAEMEERAPEVPAQKGRKKKRLVKRKR